MVIPSTRPAAASFQVAVLLLLVTIPLGQVTRVAAEGPSWRFWPSWSGKSSGSREDLGRKTDSEGSLCSNQRGSGRPSAKDGAKHCGWKASSYSSISHTGPPTPSATFDSDSLEVLTAAGRISGAQLLNRVEKHIQDTAEAGGRLLVETKWSGSKPSLARADTSSSFQESLHDNTQNLDSQQLDHPTGILPRTGIVKRSTAERTCWVNAYVDLTASCKEVLSNDTRKAELSLQLANCFLEGSGRARISCERSSLAGGHDKLKTCLGSLTDHQHSVYLAFYLDCPNICHFLQSNLFKAEVEESVNSLKATAGWLHSEISEMSATGGEILEAAAQAQQAQQTLLLQQQEAMEHVDVVRESVREIQGSLESVGSRQKDIAQDLAQGFDVLGKGAQDLSLAMQESLVRQLSFAKSQEKAVGVLRELKQDQEVLVKQHKEDLWQLFQLAKSHQDRTEAWHEQMGAMQDKVLSGQDVVKERMIQLKEEQLVAAQMQSDLMGDLAERTVAYHASSREWQAEARKVQEELLLGQRKVAWGLAAAARDMEEFHQQELQWSSRIEQQQQQLASGAREILRVQDEFSQKQKDVLGLLDRLLSFQSRDSVRLGFILFYGAAAIVTLLLTCTNRTASARMPLLIVWACTLGIEWHLHQWSMGQGSSPSSEPAPGPKSFSRVQDAVSTLVSLCRWLYTCLASVLLLVHAFSYRDLAAASHAILQRQSGHFQALLLGLQEVVQNFSHARQQHQHQPWDGQAGGDRHVPEPPDLVPRRQRQRYEQDQQSLRNDRPHSQQEHQPQWHSPEAEDDQLQEESYDDEVESGDEAASPLVIQPQRSGDSRHSALAGSQYFTAMTEQLLWAGREKRYSGADPSSSGSHENGMQHPDEINQHSMGSSSAGFSRISMAEEKARTPSRSYRDATSSALSRSILDAASAEVLRRSPRLARLREAQEQQRQTQELQQERERAEGGASRSVAVKRAAKRAVKRAVGNCRMRGLAPGSYVQVSSGSEAIVMEAEDDESDQEYEPSVDISVDGGISQRTYNLRSRSHRMDKH